MSRVGLLAIAAFTVASVPADASAKQPPAPPSNVSAVSQYVEVVPTGTGSRALGAGTSKPRTLPSRIRTAVVKGGGKDSQNLLRVATAPGLGAPPAQTVQRPVRPAPGEAQTPNQNPGLGKALTTTFSMAADGTRRIGALSLVLLLISIVMVGAFARRFRNPLHD